MPPAVPSHSVPRSTGPVAPRPSPVPVESGDTAIGLSTRKASLLAYSAGWISGLLVLWLEGRNRDVRFHAAQSLLAFGMLTLIGAVLMALAFAGLVRSLTLFRVSLWGAQGLIGVGVALWLYALVRVATGRGPRWIGVAGRADRLAGR